MPDVKQELLETAASMLPDPVKTIALLEHQIDLIGQIVLDLADDATLSEAAQERVIMLQLIMEHSSVDFEHIEEQLHAYKIPKAIEKKAYTRLIQERYLQAQIRAGVFGSEG